MSFLSLLKQPLIGVLKNSLFKVCGQKPSEIMKEFSFLTKVQILGLQNIVQNSEFRNSYFQKPFLFRSLLVVNFLLPLHG